MHTPGSIARKGANLIGMGVQFGLASFAGEIKISVCLFPSYFFVRFVDLVVKHLVVDQGCARFIRGWQFSDPVFSRQKGAGMAPFSLYCDPVGDSRYFRQPGAILSIF